MSLTIAAILAAARTPRPVTPCHGIGQRVPYFEVRGGRAACPVCRFVGAVRDDCDGSVFTFATDHQKVTACSNCGERGPCSCAGREAVKVLCAGLTDEQLRAEIERIADLDPHIHSNDYRAKHEARAALETERDRRSRDAAIATLPEHLQ